MRHRRATEEFGLSFLDVICCGFGAIILFFVFLYFVPVNLWITAIFSGVKVGLFELVFMRIRKVPPRIIVESLITAIKASISLKGKLIVFWMCVLGTPKLDES